MKNILIICGPSGSGKGTIISYLEKELSSAVFRPSDLSREFLKTLKIPITRENLSLTMQSMRRIFGNDIYVTSAIQFIESQTTDFVLFDGIRKIHFIKKIMEYSQNAKILYVKSNIAIRYERLKNRGEKDDENNMSFTEFQNQEQLESESELIEIMNIADVVIENNETERELQEKVRCIITNLYQK